MGFPKEVPNNCYGLLGCERGYFRTSNPRVGSSNLSERAILRHSETLVSAIPRANAPWLDMVVRAEWRNPEDVKASYPKASILKASRVVFNIKGNDYRLIARIQYQAGALAIRFFGTHAEYDRIDAETV
jgi:mRNA interferase HigB